MQSVFKNCEQCGKALPLGQSGKCFTCKLGSFGGSGKSGGGSGYGRGGSSSPPPPPAAPVPLRRR